MTVKRTKLKLSTLIFDLDGTLYSSKALTTQYNIEIAKLVSTTKNVDEKEANLLIERKRRQLEKKLGFRPTLTSTIEGLKIGRRELYKAVERVNPSKFLTPTTHLIELIKKLSKIYKLAVLTDSSTQQAIRTLSALGLDLNNFEVILGGDMVRKIKPDKEPFMKVVNFLREDPKRCVSIGDRFPIDLVPAKKLGMKTVLLAREKISSPHVDITISNLLQLRDALRKLKDNTKRVTC